MPPGKKKRRRRNANGEAGSGSENKSTNRDKNIEDNKKCSRKGQEEDESTAQASLSSALLIQVL